MTVTLLPTGVNDSSESSELNFDDLPPAEEIQLPPAMDAKPDVGEETPAGICSGCNEVIVRAPGARGRIPKMHPECRPLKVAGGSSSGTARGQATKVRESDEAVAAFKSLVTKGAIMLSIVDRFDAFCIMSSLPQIADNLHGVCMRYDGFRKEMLAIKGGGSIFGLIISTLMLALPIAAHHGLIPSKRAAELLVNAPVTLFQINQKLADGTASLAALMKEQMDAALKAKRPANSGGA